MGWLILIDLGGFEREGDIPELPFTASKILTGSFRRSKLPVRWRTPANSNNSLLQLLQ